MPYGDSVFFSTPEQGNFWVDHVVSGLITQIWDIVWHQIWYGFEARDVTFPTMCKYTNLAVSTAHTMHRYNLDTIKLTGYTFYVHVYHTCTLYMYMYE